MTSNRCDVLILAAHSVELLGLVSQIGSTLVGDVQGRNVVAASVGVGLVAAASGATKALADHSPRAAVLVGSYGIFPGRAGELLELAVLGDACLMDSQVEQGYAAFPDAMEPRLTWDAPLSKGIAGVVSCRSMVSMATTLAITTDDGLAAQLRNTTCHGENLEAHAVAHACQRAGVAAAAVLGATNWVGSQGRAQWKENHAEVARRSANAVMAWLQQGAPGLS